MKRAIERISVLAALACVCLSFGVIWHILTAMRPNPKPRDWIRQSPGIIFDTNSNAPPVVID